MPHSLLELNAMSEEQLRALGESLNIKNAKKLSMEELGFAILDEEANIELLFFHNFLFLLMFGNPPFAC